MINQDELNTVQLNAFDVSQRPCQGITLADLRIRLRNELSSYQADSLISNDPSNDIEKQFINDGISCLWPHDYEVVMQSFTADRSPSYRYQLPDNAEHVFSVFSGDIDINNNNVSLTPYPHHDMWTFDKSYIMAATVSLVAPNNNLPWFNEPKKAVQIVGPVRGKWVIVRYARKWAPLDNEGDCIDPSPNRINSVIFYACYQYFVSQMQVNTESIRYRNYQSIAQQFQQYYMQQLIRDSKPLYIS